MSSLHIHRRKPPRYHDIPDEVWGEMNRYERRLVARATGENGLPGLLADEIRHPWKGITPDDQAAADGARSRMHAFEWQEDGRFLDVGHGPSDRFASPLHLVQTLEASPQASRPKTRRLYVVENMEPRALELLGCKLHIPPEVLLAHCDEAVNLTVVNGQWRAHARSTYWSVPYNAVRKKSKAQPAGVHKIECGHIDRGETNSSGGSGLLECTGHKLSCWSTAGVDEAPEEEEAWKVVLLVDAHDMSLRDTKTAQRYPLANCDFPAQRQVYAEAFAEGAWRADDRRPGLAGSMVLPLARPLYDSMVEAYGSWTGLGSSSLAVQDPFSATAIPRRLLYAQWAEFVRRKDDDLRNMVWDDEESHRKAPAQRGKGVDYIFAEQYEALLQLRNGYRSYHSDLSKVMWSFRAEGVEARDGKASRRREEECDEDLWSRLEARLVKMRQEVGEHMDMVAQRAALLESLSSKQQARSAKQLTLIATVVVPCTLVASILSMGGDFAAGESLFGVYWAISLPVTCLLFGWVLFGQALQSRWKETVPRARWPSQLLSVWRRLGAREVDEEKGEKGQ